MVQISLLICTFNRADTLNYCLNSLTKQTIPPSLFEVIIINNNSSDDTAKIAASFVKEHNNFQLVFEPKKGLSHARNRGINESKSDWIAFIDDDAKAHPNFVEVALDTIQNYDFDCFGGFYNAWFRHGPPPSWLPKDFGTNRTWLPDKLGELPPDKEFSGGVCAYRKQVVIEAGLFPTFLGMQGDKIGYGEENYIQRRIRELGYKVGFNPNLQIDHEVRKEKLTVRWHLFRSFAIKRDHLILSQEKIPLRRLLSMIKRELYSFTKRIFKSGRAYFEKKISFDEFMLQVLSPTFAFWGQIAGSIKLIGLRKKRD
jgi:glycosyltransferase involved in cell wall biosynthesis